MKSSIFYITTHLFLKKILAYYHIAMYPSALLGYITGDPINPNVCKAIFEESAMHGLLLSHEPKMTILKNNVYYFHACWNQKSTLAIQKLSHCCYYLKKSKILDSEVLFLKGLLVYMS